MITTNMTDDVDCSGDQKNASFASTGGLPEDTLSQLRHKASALRAQLEAVKRRRTQVKDLIKRHDELRAIFDERANAAAHRQGQALLDLHSALRQKLTVESTLAMSQQWNAINDCFHISHLGPFATINELRLGAEAPLLESGDVDNKGVASPRVESPSQAGGSQTRPSYFSFSQPAAVDAAAAAAKSSFEPPTTTAPIRVPWNEINAALGLLALLLSILEKRAHCGIKYRHEIVPQGSTSKIGIRRGGDSLNLYNLYSDDSFQFFGRRNFNVALECLLECVVDAAEAIQRRDRTIALPHLIERTNRGDLVVGGVPVVYGQDSSEWTRAMKYLVTDIKHLMTFRLFGLSTSSVRGS